MKSWTNATDPAALALIKGPNIVGNHYMSHNLQLVYSNVIKHDTSGDNKIKKITENVYKVMSNYNTEQAGSIFLEAASRMNRLVLTNKSRKKTHFFCSNLSGIQAYMMNIPTIYSI